MGIKENFKKGWLYALIAVVIMLILTMISSMIFIYITPELHLLATILYVFILQSYRIILICSISHNVLVGVIIGVGGMFIILSLVLGKIRRMLEDKIKSVFWKRIIPILIGIVIILLIELITFVVLHLDFN